MSCSLKTDDFCQKCPFKNGTSSGRIQKQRPHIHANIRNDSLKMVEYTIVLCVYHVWMSFRQILKFSNFMLILAFPLKKGNKLFGWMENKILSHK